MKPIPIREDEKLVHPTAPRVGVFIKAERARSTGPKSHQSPYVADEERSTNEKVLHALIVFAATLLGLYLGFSAGLAVWPLILGHGQ